MTEREAVNTIERFVSMRGGTYREYGEQELDVAYHDMTHTCIFIWGGADVRDCIFRTQIPEEIRWLKHLRQVDVRYPAQDCRWLGQVERIEILRVDVHGDQFPETWLCCESLRKLVVSFPRNGSARAFPPSFRQFKALREIAVSSSFYPIRLPDWLHELPKLNTLSLENCRLKAIPYSVVQTELEFETENVRWYKNGIHLAGVRLEEGSLELFSQSRDVIEHHYQREREHQPISRECKVIFLGDGSAGKSSLIDRILYDRFEEGKLPTDGIHISTWDTVIRQEEIRLRFLDFGGQEIMHAMHRCFLTPHTVYVVVCASRDDSEIGLTAARWLDNVRTFAPGCPVILVLNKIDQNERVQVNQEELLKRNPDLRRIILYVSAKEPEMGNGVTALTKEIKKAVPDCINQLEADPKILQLKRDMENMRADYISAEQYQKLCRNHNIDSPERQRQLLEWFRDMGVSYFYEDERLNTVLESVRVLNPAWLTKGIYRLILHTHDGGLLSHREIKETLFRLHAHDSPHEETYSAQETEFVLHVMRAFQISHNMGNGMELVPMKMSKTPPSSAKEFPRNEALHLRWRASFLPSSLIHRMMIQKADELDMDCVWRTGGCFRKESASALAELKGQVLDIYVMADFDARYYMEEFRFLVRKLLDGLNIDAQELICHRIDGQEGEMSYKSVLRQYRDKRDLVFFDDIEQYISPAELLKETYLRPDEELEHYQCGAGTTTIYAHTVNGVTVTSGSSNVVVPGDGNRIATGNGNTVVEGHVSAMSGDGGTELDGIKMSEIRNRLFYIYLKKKIPFWERNRLRNLLLNLENLTDDVNRQEIRRFLYMV